MQEKRQVVNTKCFIILKCAAIVQSLLGMKYLGILLINDDHSICRKLLLLPLVLHLNKRTGLHSDIPAFQ